MTNDEESLCGVFSKVPYLVTVNQHIFLMTKIPTILWMLKLLKLTTHMKITHLSPTKFPTFFVADISEQTQDCKRFIIVTMYTTWSAKLTIPYKIFALHNAG